jgi:hypothetical protein
VRTAKVRSHLNPTTLRLTATELVNSPLATDCYKTSFVMNLADLQVSRIATRNPRFSTDIERAWVQKWVQRLCPLTVSCTATFDWASICIFYDPSLCRNEGYIVTVH